ncbi:MAG: CocE/NonD family hydrolase [Janthinobacterium lividum]
MHISDATTWEGPDPGFWVPNGYVIVVANARGYYDSEGEAGIYADHDPQDYADLIEWAGVQPWSSGAVGLNGVSYLAVSQWMCASETKPQHLKAIVPWEGVSDLLRDLMEHGGIPETRFLEGYYSGSLARGAGDGIAAQGHAMLQRAAQVPFPLEKIDVPTLVCGSWSDHGLHTRGAFEGFLRISSPQKWLYTHGGNKWERYYSPDALEWQKAFLDHFLKGEDNGFEQRRRVRLEVRRTKEEFEVRSEDNWPVNGVEFSPRYLDAERGSLLSQAPVEPQSRLDDAEAKATVDFDLVFDEPIEVTGPMVLKLWISALDADDLDLFVAVRKIDRDGQVVHFQAKDGYRDGEVAFGWLRTSQRHLDPERSWSWHPYLSRDRTEKVQPGAVVVVEIEILASSTIFEAGDTLRLMVSGHDILEFGRFGHDERVNKGRYEIHAGGDYPSHLLIPFCRHSGGSVIASRIEVMPNDMQLG